MALHHEGAELAVVLVLQRLGRLLGTLNLRDDVTGALQHDAGDAPVQSLQVGHGGIAKGLLPQGLGGLLALPASGGVLAARQLVLDVGVGDQHHQFGVLQRHQPRLEGPAVDEQRVALLAHDGDELVHDAARHAGELVLRLLAH